MKRIPLALCAALLAACGPSTADESASDAAATDSALDAITQPAAQPSASPVARETALVRSVNGRLERAQKDAAARGEEAAEQVRAAEGGTSNP